MPPEPAEGEPGAVRVALRLPDGRRLMRRFLASHTLAALADLCTAEVPEAAAGRGWVAGRGGARDSPMRPYRSAKEMGQGRAGGDAGCHLRWDRGKRAGKVAAGFFPLALLNLPVFSCWTRRLVLAFAQPGAQPLSDMGQTLQEAGVAGAMLNVKLAD